MKDKKRKGLIFISSSRNILNPRYIISFFKKKGNNEVLSTNYVLHFFILFLKEKRKIGMKNENINL